MVNMMIPAVRKAARNRPLLLRGASMAAVVCGLAAGPVHAQSVARPPNMRQIMSSITAPTVTAAGGIVRPPNMRQALARAQSHAARAEQLRSFVTSARDAALAATRTNPSDGLSDKGLDPIASVREAAALIQAGGENNLARANQLMISVSANNDATGRNTWQGATAPVQTTENGRTTVTITQNESRALLSWNRFDIGANTTLQIDQKQGGVGQPGWTAVNRVVGSVAPSTILGNLKADGTVLVLNQRGVIFGQNSQVNLHSLLASTLELGNFGRDLRDVDRTTAFQALSLKERNTAYLQNGLFTLSSARPGVAPPLLLSPQFASGEGRIDAMPPIEGAVTVDAGASINAGPGGFIILAGPKVESAGVLSASDGQVSLQGGRFIAAALSTGDANSADPDVRGIILRSAQPGRNDAGQPLDSTPEDGIVINRGLVDSRRGYISLGAGLYGEVTNAGLLAATTSVSRNGKVALTAGRVTIAGAAAEAQAGGIVILPDANGETIPQGTAAEPPSFKTSKIEIGARADAVGESGDPLGVFIPSVVTLGRNSLILAPSADVVIGRAGDVAFDPIGNLRNQSSIDIQQGAVIDVSGVKDIELDIARNSIEIAPVKRNELRDTPTYREVSRDPDDFTLNGQTLFIDTRRSGVRDDGVAWIGSPLIEAGSLASQIGVTAAVLMTKGGNVSLGVNLLTGAVNGATVPSINVARDAVIDFSGGWVRYNQGIVRTSRLITDDGRFVDIGNADPNDIYVGVSNGFTAVQPRFGISRRFQNILSHGGSPEGGYDEGRDAGSLVIGASAARIDGSFYGSSFNGGRQIAAGKAASLKAGGSDPRALQGGAGELAAGGFLRIGSFTGKSGVAAGGDIIVYHGERGAGATRLAELLLSDQMLSTAGLSALTLQTTGSVIFAGASQPLLQPAGAVSLTGASKLELAPGGVLTVDAGRSIRFDGDIRIPSGTIAARTYELSPAPIAGGFSAIGSAFRTDDDIAGLYAPGSALPRPFDISVTGTLSTAGLWTNSLLEQDDLGGSAWIDGGSISLTVAPKVLVAIGESVGTAEKAGDLSGSIAIASGALLDVSAGAYAAPDGALALTGRGGDVSLINETTYASVIRTATATPENQEGNSDRPIAGSNQSVDFTPDEAVVPALVPDAPVASVTFAEGSIKGFGFAGGGTLRLVSPDITFDAEGGAGATQIPLDFLATTGFGTLDLTSFRSRIVPDLFSNARAGNSAFFETTSFVVRNGQTLDLTQTMLPSFLDTTQSAALLALESGGDIRSVLAPVIPQAAWDRRAANLTLGGLAELVVEQGGRIVGAPEAVLTLPKLSNAGTIELPGGSIVQRAVLPAVLANSSLGVRDLAAVFGPADASGRFDETAQNAAGIADPARPGVVLTNRELLTKQGAERFVHFVGALDASEGIRLEAGSVTDLSGTALFDPRAPLLNGTQLRQGRIVKGGTIATAAAFTPSETLDPDKPENSPTLFSNPAYGNVRYSNLVVSGDPPLMGLVAGRKFNALPSSTIDISGASAVFDELATPTSYAAVDHWSDGGGFSILAGGSIAGSLIDASGGASAATGGSLEWLRPILRQQDPGVVADGAIFADQIEAAGFDTLIARGGITFDGQVSLALDKRFALLSAPAATNDVLGLDATISVSATNGTTASIAAPYIRFASRRGSTAGESFTAGRGNASVTFDAGLAGIDMAGAVLFDSSVAQATLLSEGDLRLTGVDDRGRKSIELPALNGELIAQGNLTIDAARVFATTGTGNLQRIIEDRRAGRRSAVSPYLIAATGDSTIRFGGSNINAATPLSAGSYLRVQAANIEQGGNLAAPMGLLEIGSNEAIGSVTSRRFVLPTESVLFGAGSVTTVSGAGVNVPYGTTTDLTEYFFTPSVNLPLTAPPVGELRIGGGTIDVAVGALVDVHGGGNLFGFEFVSGTGGSRDVLDRFNRDRFSSNDFDPATGIGYQFADHRQVFAIMPKRQASAIADFDPIYSADYGAAGPVDLYGAQAGLSVTLDAAPGIEAGEYLLLPAHYALQPGGMRLVENVGATAPLPGTSQTLLDGSIQVGGSYSTAGTDQQESARRQFTVQTSDTFLRYSRIETTDAAQALAALAGTRGLTAPRSPLDAARVVLSPLTALRVASAFDTRAAAGGRGAQFDIGGTDIILAGDDAEDVEGSVTLRNGTLANLNANSLVIGAERTDNVDSTTTLDVLASSITVAEDARVEAPELVLAVGGGLQYEIFGITPSLLIEDGAELRASGSLADARDRDYVIPASGTSSRFDRTGIGAVLRLAQGPERLIARQGFNAAANSLRTAELKIGAATLSADNIALDSSRNFNIAAEAVFEADNISLSGDVVRFGNAFIKPEVEAKLAAADRLTLRSPEAVGFAKGVHDFNDLTIDAPAIALVALGPNASVQSNVVINADEVRLGNSGKDFGGCVGVAIRACGHADNLLQLNATEIAFGSGQLRTYGFDGSVALTATRGIYVEGEGGLDVGGASLSLTTPFIADRAIAADPRKQTLQPELEFATTKAVSLAAPPIASGAAQPTPSGDRAPGTRIAFGSIDAPVQAISIDGTSILATAGIVDIRSTGDVTVAGATQLATPGYAKTFGDASDSTTVSAGAGAINILSLTGDIVLPSTSTLIVDSYDGPDANGRLDQNDGRAGSIGLFAARGGIDVEAALNPGVTGPRNASFAFDAGTSGFDLPGFVTRYGTSFQGDISIRAGLGNLALGAGQTMRAESVSLTADGGAISIAGTIDTSGQSVAGLDPVRAAAADVNGGDVALYGDLGVSVAATARIDTHTTGYADTDTRTATAGDVTIGIGDPSAAISIAVGAQIDVGARRAGNRLVPQIVKDPVTLTDTTVYRFAGADEGGTVTFRAPVMGEGGKFVDIRLPGGNAVSGAKSIQVEGFRRYDIDAIASTGLYDGVLRSGAITYLDLATGLGDEDQTNFLTEDLITEDGLPSLVNFIRNFGIAAADGSSLDGMRLRPGVELTSANNIAFLSNWNLGAGVVDQLAAQNDGLLVPIGQLNGGGRMEGDPYLAVAPGREAELFENYVTMTYRVGGRVDGEAPVITLRSNKSIQSEYSISDGFFLFRDRSDPFYMSYAMGGGDRQVLPAATFTCATLASGNCGDVLDFHMIASGQVAFDPAAAAAINLTTIVAGSDIAPSVLAPYSARANSPAALGGLNEFDEEIGDPLGNMELFPLLKNGTEAVKSSSFRLVGGAGEAISTNPLHIDRATRGDVAIMGERSYAIVATKGAFSQYMSTGGIDPLTGRPAGDYALQLRITPEIGDLGTEHVFGPAGKGLIEAANSSSSNLGGVDSDELYTVLTWGAGQGDRAAFVREKAAEFFNYIDTASYDFSGYPELETGQRDALRLGIAQGPKKAPSGVAARLSDILAFLEVIGPEFAENIVKGSFPAGVPNPPAPIGFGANRNAYYGSVVRTGAGSIDITSANDVKLIRTDDVVYRTALNPLRPEEAGRQQVGGTAVYTAGHIATREDIFATSIDGNLTVRLAWGDRPVAADTLNSGYLPSPKGQFLHVPALITGGGAIGIEAGGDVIGRRDAWAESFLATEVRYNRFTVGRPATATSKGTFDGVAGAAQRFGTGDQVWRPGVVGQDTVIAVVPQLFTSGIGALAGDDVNIRAGGDVRDLTVALDTSVVTANANGSGSAPTIISAGAASAPIQVSFNRGDLALAAGGDLIGGQFDIASGAGDIAVGGDVYGAGPTVKPSPEENRDVSELRLRVTDAAITLSARGSVELAGIGALGAGEDANSAGNLTAVAGLDLIANGRVSITGSRRDQARPFELDGLPLATGYVLPGSLGLASLTDDVVLPTAVPYLLYPSAIGQLSLLAGGDIEKISLAMSDSDPSLLPGAFTAFASGGRGLAFGFPGVLPTTSDATLRLYHNQRPTHAGDPEPTRIYADGSISSSVISLPKQARIGAGLDLVDIYFVGQNVAATDVTRITAGRDIIATTRTARVSGRDLPYLVSNSFTLGGPGTLYVEAGRNLGPFANSAVVNGVSLAGGIRTVGNDFNPWLAPEGADIFALFGVANGADYEALREAYVNPANAAELDGDLFLQRNDPLGNAHPDRSKGIYAMALIGWLLENDPDALASAMGGQIGLTGADVVPLLSGLEPETLKQFLVDLPNLPAQGIASATVAIDRNDNKAPKLIADPQEVADLATKLSNPADTSVTKTTITTVSGATLIGWLALNAPDVLRGRYGVATVNVGAAYDRFAALDTLRQRNFLLKQVYFNELSAPARPDSPSFEQYVRGYRAVQALFPAERGYTDNLSAYTTDPSTINPDHPLGVPTRKLVNGEPQRAERVITGNVDLRLATIGTGRGGDVTILGPGGDFIAGSIVRTSEQAARRASRLGFSELRSLEFGYFNSLIAEAVDAIPLGYEGILTLRGGAIRSFTDGDFRLNQSRVFTQAGGDITMWSSNGDLNAGQGPKSASNFPPIAIRFDPNGLAEVNTAGSVSGAGIGAFKRSPDDPGSDVLLIAPVGEVDAGDAGVRASGNVFVAAAQVANADNFKAGGDISGVPSAAVAAAPAVPTSAASSVVAQVARLANANADSDSQSMITVDVLGYAGEDASTDVAPEERDDDTRR